MSQDDLRAGNHFTLTDSQLLDSNQGSSTSSQQGDIQNQSRGKRDNEEFRLAPENGEPISDDAKENMARKANKLHVELEYVLKVATKVTNYFTKKERLLAPPDPKKNQRFQPPAHNVQSKKPTKRKSTMIKDHYSKKTSPESKANEYDSDSDEYSPEDGNWLTAAPKILETKDKYGTPMSLFGWQIEA
jgi:SNF2 family DNA or RNA helicase